MSGVVINGPDAPKSNFRFTPESGLNSDITPCPKSAISDIAV
jgi:hypothetical protein